MRSCHWIAQILNKRGDIKVTREYFNLLPGRYNFQIWLGKGFLWEWGGLWPYMKLIKLANLRFTSSLNQALRQLLHVNTIQYIIAFNFLITLHKSALHMGRGIQEWTKLNLWRTALKWYDLLHITSDFLKTVFHKFY